MNKQRFYVRMISGSLFRRRSRMITALLAIAVGAAILSTLVTISLDIPRQMGREFRSYGANLAFVPSGESQNFALADFEKALALLPAGSLVGAAPYRYLMAKINEQPVMIAGTVLAEARKTSPLWLVHESWPAKAGEALIGQEVADMFRLVPGNGFTVQTGTGPGRDFSVSGIVQSGGTEESFIFISLEDFAALAGNGAFIDSAECSVSLDQAALAAAAERIGLELPGVSARLVKRVTDSEAAVLTKLKVLIALVTVIVLLLTMICVATTMMAVVAERRREIGLRKALGAANRDLAGEFMGEGIALGAAGGLLGAAAGFALAFYVGLRVFNRPVDFQPLLLPLTVLASVLVTAVSCVIPVRSAASVDPAIVLRGE
jgi:putative ABC transport system permease protein